MNLKMITIGNQYVGLTLSHSKRFLHLLSYIFTTQAVIKLKRLKNEL
jgi:hypothetical protein